MACMVFLSCPSLFCYFALICIYLFYFLGELIHLLFNWIYLNQWRISNMSLKHIKLKHNYNLSKKTMSLTNIRGESGSLFKRVFTLVISNSPISHWRLQSLFKRVFTFVISNSPIFHWRFKFKVGRIWELPFHHSNYIPLGQNIIIF